MSARLLVDLAASLFGRQIMPRQSVRVDIADATVGI
jgi:hypothetical protein